MLEQIKLIEVEQTFSPEKVDDIDSLVKEMIFQNDDLLALPKKAEIAITAGSRGIANIREILKSIVTALKKMDYCPFLIPAMGSHGGATAEGQIQVLAHLGITPETIGAEIRSSMDVVRIGYTEDDIPIYMDQYATEADGIIVVNRIKAHTAFRGRVESGLSKMVTIGLGKQKGASFVHINGAQNMEKNIIAVCRGALKHSNILMGIAIIENSYDETSQIVAVNKENWFEKEASLLLESKRLMPKLPIEQIDLLIIEEMGKIFSGTGMDPNIIGRWRVEGVPEPETPNVKRLAILDIAERSFGNAQGIGLADFTTEKLVNKIDRKATYMNAMTSTYLQRAMLPFIFPNERVAIEQALTSLGPYTDYQNVKYIQIPNTLHLNRLIVSEPVLEEMRKLDLSFKVGREINWEFNKHSDLLNRLTPSPKKE